MRSIAEHLLVALAITLAVGLLSGGGWHFLVGAGLSLSLWVMLFAGSYAAPDREGRGRTTVRGYAMAAVVSVALGYWLYLVMDNASFWAVGFIIGGVVLPTNSFARRDVDGGRTGEGG